MRSLPQNSIYRTINVKSGDDMIVTLPNGNQIRISYGGGDEIIVAEITGNRLQIQPAASNAIRVKADKP